MQFRAVIVLLLKSGSSGIMFKYYVLLFLNVYELFSNKFALSAPRELFFLHFQTQTP